MIVSRTCSQRFIGFNGADAVDLRHVKLDERRKTASQQSVHDQTVSLQSGPTEILQSEPLFETKLCITPLFERRLASEDHPSSNYELNHDRRSRQF
jgi:hypothetical protein